MQVIVARFKRRMAVTMRYKINLQDKLPSDSEKAAVIPTASELAVRNTNITYTSDTNTRQSELKNGNREVTPGRQGCKIPKIAKMQLRIKSEIEFKG